MHIKEVKLLLMKRQVINKFIKPIFSKVIVALTIIPAAVASRQGTTITLNLSKIDATKTKLNCQSIYGNLEKRKSSTSSRVKNCFNLTPANDNPGCVTYASWRRWIYYLAKQNRPHS